MRIFYHFYQVASLTIGLYFLAETILIILQYKHLQIIREECYENTAKKIVGFLFYLGLYLYLIGVLR